MVRSKRIALEVEAMEGLARDLAKRASELASASSGVYQAVSLSGLPGYAYETRRDAGDVGSLGAQLISWASALRTRAALTRIAADHHMPWLLMRVQQMEARDPRGAFRAFATQMTLGASTHAGEHLTGKLLGFVGSHGVMPQPMRELLLESLEHARRQLLTDYFGSAATGLVAGPMMASDDIVRASASRAHHAMDGVGGLAFGALVDAGIQTFQDRDEGLTAAEQAGRAAIAGAGGLAAGALCVAIGLGSFGVGGLACAAVLGTTAGYATNEINEKYIPTDSEAAAAAAAAEAQRHLDNLAKLDAFYEEYGGLSVGDRKAMLATMDRTDRYVRNTAEGMVVEVTYYRRDGSVFARQEVEKPGGDVLSTYFYDEDGEAAA